MSVCQTGWASAAMLCCHAAAYPRSNLISNECFGLKNSHSISQAAIYDTSPTLGG
eukprot:m.116422 g.116422  ORF g.116422 m.116422 type:complete len:55 (+) comp15518_c0_seq2:88-252(+)